MMHLVGDIVKHFTFDDTNIDNWMFKMFYKGSFIMFLMGSMVGILSQYLGEPISCDFKGIDGEMASDYCWIHGSSYIPPEYQHHMKCIVELDGVESSDDAPDTSYYQWVTFVMMFQAGSFVLPYKFWRAMENGLLEEFGSEAKTAVLLKDEFEDAVVIDAVIEKYIRFFKSILHRNNWYFFKFLTCEFLNFCLLFTHFWLTDKFLNGKFWYYGWDVIQYTRLSREEQKVNVNPFCSTFPLEVSCTVPNVGAAGGEQNHNGLCVLSQNVINEKMYLAVWFWMVFLIFLTVPFIIYRLSVLMFDCLRASLLMSQVGNTNDKEARKAIRYVLNKCYIGDWFVLYQLSKNVNMYFFRAFIKELKQELKLNPKKSKLTYIDNPLKTVCNHIPSIPTAENDTNNGADEEEDDDVEKGELTVGMPEEEGENTSLLTEEAHQAPTIRRMTSKRQSSVGATEEAASHAGMPRPGGRMGGRMGKMGKGGKMGKVGKARGGGRKGMKKGGGKGKGMGGMDDFEMDMMMMNF